MNFNYSIIPWDTKVIGKNVIEINNSFDIDKKVYNEFEANLSLLHSPYMLFCKVPINDINRIHFLEEYGYRYIETQFHILKRIQEKYKIHLGIEYSPIEDKDLASILDIAKTTFDTDRYSIDPFIGKTLAGERYSNWILDSINNEKYQLFKYISDNDIVGFHFIKVEDEKAFGLLGGVKQEYKSTGIGFYINLMFNNLLYDKGIKTLDTHISAANMDIFNIDIYMQYKIKDVMVVLRKIFI